MLASELVEKLESLIEDNGDVEIQVEYGEEINQVIFHKAKFFKDMFVIEFCTDYS